MNECLSSGENITEANAEWKKVPKHIRGPGELGWMCREMTRGGAARTGDVSLGLGRHAVLDNGVGLRGM